jgi:hypothetical protein
MLQSVETRSRHLKTTLHKLRNLMWIKSHESITTVRNIYSKKKFIIIINWVHALDIFRLWKEEASALAHIYIYIYMEIIAVNSGSGWINSEPWYRIRLIAPMLWSLAAIQARHILGTVQMLQWAYISIPVAGLSCAPRIDASNTRL